MRLFDKVVTTNFNIARILRQPDILKLYLLPAGKSIRKRNYRQRIRSYPHIYRGILMKREKLDATCPVGWYEFDLVTPGINLPGNRRMGWWNGSDIYGDKACTCRIGDHYSNFIGPLVEVTGATPADVKELENVIHELCDLANVAKESRPREYEEPAEYSLGTRVAWLREYLIKQKSLQEQLEKTEASLAERERSQAVRSWCSIDEANKWPEGSHVLECVLRDNGTVFEYRATTIWKPNRGKGHSRPSCYALIKAPDALAVQYGSLTESQVKDRLIQALKEDLKDYRNRFCEHHGSAGGCPPGCPVCESQKLDKTVCELEMDLDAARKRCHTAEATIEKLREKIRHTESLDRRVVHSWLAVRNLYLVTGTALGQRDAKLYVLAMDAGFAEDKARKTWRSWKYSHEPVEAKLVGKSAQYGPEGVVTVVG